MKAYKLTDEFGFTKGNTKWGEGVSHTAIGNDTPLCSDGWIHFYIDPILAVIVNPGHSNFKSPILWECETAGEVLHDPFKSGCKTLTTIKRIPLPEVTPLQRIAFLILCVKEVYKDERWNEWADNWLNNTDRSVISSEDAFISSIDAYAIAHVRGDFAGRNAGYAASYTAAYASIIVNSTNYSYAAYAINSSAFVSSKTADFIEIAKKALTYN